MPIFSFSSKQKTPVFYLSNSKSELVLEMGQGKGEIWEHFVMSECLKSNTYSQNPSKSYF